MDTFRIVSTGPASDATLLAIAGERAYQNDIAAKYNHAGTPSLESDMLQMRRLVGVIEETWYVGSNNQEVMANVRKLAAVALRSLDNHGAPTRPKTPAN